ncbi:HAMP domain-containing sensor histidine kinase [Pedobacter nutrimenti]|uniref:sensor histidine kinase n=1 Tax=Pedobacter nutrimenti TaxID=1241337 RepID=UPI0029306EB1|nr:HAMP domain-containing sensor histidine kinase [Pedobacter nutrimenti]
MKRKLLFIAVPIVVSIIGIIYFQIDWINKTYAYESKKLYSIADESLIYAIRDLNRMQEDSVRNFLRPKISMLTGLEVLFSKKRDSLIIKINDQVRDKAGSKPLARISYDVEKVAIDYPYYKAFRETVEKDVAGSKSIQKDVTNKFEEIMAPFIQTRDSVYFKSDSIKIRQNILRHLSMRGIKNVDDVMKMSFYKSENIPHINQSAIGTFEREYQPQGLNGYTNGKRWVMVCFSNRDNYILSKMITGSILSIVLILIMVTSFIYLIWIILKQKRLSEMKDDFINNLTHEFKTPISTIAVAIEGMQHFNALNDLQKTNRYLTIAKNELGRLSSMVSKVLNLASQERNSIELNICEIDLTNMVQEIIGMEHFRAAKEVQFIVVIDKDANQINVDPEHFKNVLTNLIDNAVKYAKEKVEITIAAAKQKNYIGIVIKDNGIGIPVAEQKYIFDRFYRVSSGNIYNVKGIGLGLSYVKSIVEFHNGTIAVKSEINAGTEFSIFIPSK